MRKNSFIFFCMILLMQISLFASEIKLNEDEKAWIKNHPTIKVSNEDDWPPYDFSVDGKAQGYSVDIVKLLAKKLGVKIKFINGYTWDELLKEFDANRIDMMQCMIKTKDREKKYSFSKPYMPWRLSYFVCEDSCNINSPKDFAGKKIAAGKAWATTKFLKEAYPKAKIIEFSSSLAMVQALLTHKVDALIDNTHVINYIVRENLFNGIKHAGYIDFKNKKEINFHFVAHKKDAMLTEIFTKALDSLTPDEKDMLQNRWFSTLSEAKHTHIMANTFIPKVHFNDEQKQYLQKKKVITMCIDPKWMPYEGFDKNGHYVGISADFFKIFQKSIPIPIKVIQTKTWEESLENAKARKCDILSLVMSTPSRKKYMDFTSPYLNIPLVLATKPNVVFFDNFKVLKNKKIGIVKGYAFNEIIRKEYPNFEIVDVENIEDGLKKVVNGKLFGYIDTLASIAYMFQTKYIGELKIAGKFDEKWHLGIGVRNDEKPLFDIFEKVVKNVPADVGQKIILKTIAIKYDRHTNYTLIMKIIAGAIVLVLFMLYHNRKLTRVNKKLEELQNKLQEQAHRDPMTNLYNRRYFHEVSSSIFQIVQRDDHHISLIMIDIDNFKRINDTYGHAVGDEVIKKLASLLERNVRKSDIVSRFGGEEFVILLPSTDLKGAQKIASKIREAVEEILIVADESVIRFTISLGLADIRSSDQNIEAILNRADKALYKAKESGKNRVVVYKDDFYS